MSNFFFFNDTATTEIYTLSLHDALPISPAGAEQLRHAGPAGGQSLRHRRHDLAAAPLETARGGIRGRATVRTAAAARSEEHTSELQSRQYLVCRLLLEKKNKNLIHISTV